MKLNRMVASGAMFSLVGCVGVIGIISNQSVVADDADAGGNAPPECLFLSGVIRDFKEKNAEGGHPDFEVIPDKGYGHYCGNVAQSLDSDGKPVHDRPGFKVYTQWRDAQNRNICYRLYDPALGDQEGSSMYRSRGGIASSASFAQWFRDVPGINLSMPLTLTFHRQNDGTYVFDDSTDPSYSQLGGFFPIEGHLFGNPGGTPDRNFHFTFELHTEFTYDAAGGQIFKFIGDDDVWVFINNEMVIDLGGIHGATEQFIDLNRLGLTDGENYTLDFFFAERHRTQSNFRIVTNLVLIPARVPEITAAFD